MNVLIVDDSALVRETLGHILATWGGMNVEKAPDPLFALRKMKTWRPDVILLDVDMPRMDGLTFLRKVMAEDPIPVVVCSSLGGAGSAVAFDALDAGAVEVIEKGKLGVRDSLHESAGTLIETVLGAARVPLLARRSAAAAARPGAGDRGASRPGDWSPTAVAAGTVIAIGASTGGTMALQDVLTAMPADAPPILIVQHMPEGFTAAFAQRLNRLCRVEVKEAAEGDRIAPGRALIAHGNRHLVLRGARGKYVAQIEDGAPVSGHRPSVDVLLDSVARAAGRDAIGIVLTGMGRDGARGLLAMREAGARTIAQDEASCVVYGMPRAAVENGAAQEVLPLSRIAQLIRGRAGPHPGRTSESARST